MYFFYFHFYFLILLSLSFSTFKTDFILSSSTPANPFFWILFSSFLINQSINQSRKKKAALPSWFLTQFYSFLSSPLSRYPCNVYFQTFDFRFNILFLYSMISFHPIHMFPVLAFEICFYLFRKKLKFHGGFMLKKFRSRKINKNDTDQEGN